MDYKEFVSKKCFIVYSDVPVDSNVIGEENKEYNIFRGIGKVISAKTDAVVIREINGNIHRVSDKMILVFRTID